MAKKKNPTQIIDRIANRNKFDDLEKLFQSILSGNQLALSKAITIIESQKHEDQQKALELVERCIKHQKENQSKSLRIGITGIPGVGKSTFIDSFGMLCVEKGHKIAILAVDPSSQSAKGSILGDKTRMEKLAQQKQVFIRPSPSSGNLGGIARKTRETIMVCEVAGYDFIIVETVGVGQSETMVHQLVDMFLLLMISNAGDELQGIKRGIMELADLILINKVDNENQKKINQSKSDILRALHYMNLSEKGWNCQVETVSGLTGYNLDKAYEKMSSYFNLIIGNGFYDLNRKNQQLQWFDQELKDEVWHHFMQQSQVSNEISELKNQISNNEISVKMAVKNVVDQAINISTKK